MSNDHGLTEDELIDLWEEIDGDSSRGMDNDQYAGDGIDEALPMNYTHSKRSREIKAAEYGHTKNKQKRPPPGYVPLNTEY